MDEYRLIKSGMGKSDLEKANLFGSVKSIREKSPNGKYQTFLLPLGNDVSGVHITFEPNGNKSEQITYSSNGLIHVRTIYRNGKIVKETCGGFETMYKYDSQGDNIEKITCRSDKTIEQKCTYRFDGQGNKIEQIGYKSDGNILYKWTYRYNERGDLSEVIAHYLDGIHKIIETSSCIYDDKGNIKEKTLYRSDGCILESNKVLFDRHGYFIEEWEEYDYDQDGEVNFISAIRFDKNGNVIKDPNGVSYIYDYRGNVISINHPANDCVYEHVANYDYEFDNIGNWVKRTEYRNTLYNDYYHGGTIYMPSGEDCIVEREIEYYQDKRNVWWNIFKRDKM